mgnify:CR=1 FL=1|tara:strand:+ start:1931 stop:2371 length:441 start_codon:yes stop_codon:yes gene_type:complete
MRKFFFDAVATVAYGLIWLNDRAFSVPAALLIWIGQKIRFVLANIAFFFMVRIDPIRAKQVEAEGDSDPMDLEIQSMELQLLNSSYKVRDSAITAGGWTEFHSEAIEAIGSALLLDIGWEEEDVHTHLKSVVESIDGFTYKTFRKD